MDISKNKNLYGYYNITINNGDYNFNIWFCGNGDLYCSIDSDNFDDISSKFIINKDNYFLYSIFNDLYSDIKNANVFCNCCNDIEKNILLSNLNYNCLRSPEYNKLYNNNCIYWHSDEEIYEDANVLKIYKDNINDNFIIEIDYGKNKNIRSIRFRNSGSYYYPFNIVFMRMYDKLQLYDDDFYQISIDEYLYNKEKTFVKRK